MIFFSFFFIAAHREWQIEKIDEDTLEAHNIQGIEKSWMNIW